MAVTDAVIVLTTVASAEQGEAIAQALVDERLAACVNVLPAMASTYRWKGAVERETEHQLVIKTARERVSAVEARVRELHPYELPEFLVLSVASGGDSYLAWIREGIQHP